ncbi:unnamed protein product [Salmonella enterica subsp. enterica serovar Dublin]|nr:unnamed protein product [Salmonella enterica subsp. enterica serovar Dublin]
MIAGAFLFVPSGIIPLSFVVNPPGGLPTSHCAIRAIGGEAYENAQRSPFLAGLAGAVPELVARRYAAGRCSDVVIYGRPAYCVLWR